MKIFISYAKEDITAARHLYRDLLEAGFQPWLDVIDLLPGQKFDSEIRKAIKNCLYFVALVSSNSIEKRGYVQKEIKEALEVLETIPESHVFLIPARLDNSEPVNDKLHSLHWVDMFPSWADGIEKIIKSI